MGPYQYATHLISGPRLPFTATYLGAIVLTIYFAVGVGADPCLGILLLTNYLAAFHHPYVAIVDCATHRTDLVSCQLFPNGESRSQICCTRGWWQSGGMDERLMLYAFVLSSGLNGWIRPTQIASDAPPHLASSDASSTMAVLRHTSLHLSNET